MKIKLGLGLLIISLIIGVVLAGHAFRTVAAPKEFVTGIPILMYHKVSPDPRRGGLGLRVNPTDFENQMQLLDNLGYRTISLDFLLTSFKEDKPIPDKVVVISFDDGYRDNYLWARPIMKQYGFRGIIFLVSEQLGKVNQWDTLKGSPTNYLMSLSEIKLMLDEGFEFGSHTKSHNNLTSLNHDQARIEIAESKADLEAKLGTTIKYFCYPYGKYNQQVVTLVKKAGYQAALSTAQGKVKPGDNLFTLRRIRITGYCSPVEFVNLLNQQPDRI